VKEHSHVHSHVVVDEGAPETAAMVASGRVEEFSSTTLALLLR